MSISVSPGVTRFKEGRYDFRLTVPVSMLAYDLSGDLKMKSSDCFSDFSVDPNLDFAYTLSSSVRLSTNIAWKHIYGGLSDFMPGKLYSDYRTTKESSGILSQSNTFYAATEGCFRLPLREFFALLRIDYSRTKSDLLISDEPSEEANVIAALPTVHHNDNVNLQIETSKYFRSIHSKVSLGGNVSWGKSQLMRNKQLHLFESNMCGASFVLSSTPFKWVEMQYHLDLQSSGVSIKGSLNERTTDYKHDIKLSYLPAEGWEASLNAEYLFKEMADKHKTHFGLIGASLQRKYKRYIARIEVNNLLNQQSYSTSFFDGLQYRKAEYKLRGLSCNLLFTYFF